MAIPKIAPYASAFASPKGAGDARPTALQVVQEQGLVGELKDKVVVITGATSGIGLETAKALRETGARIFITARTAAKGAKAVEEIEATPNQDAQPIEVIEMELDSLASVKSAAEKFLMKSGRLNLLINNAGVMAPPKGTTKDGFETQFGINHVGHFLLFQLLKPALLAAASQDYPSRVVTVSSTGHRIASIQFNDYNLEKQGYDRWIGYGQAKTANVYMANEINKRYKSQNLIAFSLHPGVIFQTELSRHIMKTGAKHEDGRRDEVMEGFEDPALENLIKSSEQGAATSVWAAIAKELKDNGGLYLDDVQVAEPADPKAPGFTHGYAEHAYDEDQASRLWSESLKMVGMSEDEN